MDVDVSGQGTESGTPETFPREGLMGITILGPDVYYDPRTDVIHHRARNYVPEARLDSAQQRAKNDGVRLAAQLVRDHMLNETGQRVADFLIERADRIFPPGEGSA